MQIFYGESISALSFAIRRLKAETWHRLCKKLETDPRPWPAKEDALFGKFNNNELAKKLGTWHRCGVST